MSDSPVICFGQQPCGFFPKRFLYAKFVTARRLQAEIGGEIVFFCHDSDHDYRETKTLLRHRKNQEALLLNFGFRNKTQRKFSPLYRKEIAADWQAKTAVQIHPCIAPEWVPVFAGARAENVADFCLAMYAGMGLLAGVRVVRSSDPAVRRAACAISDCFVDVPYEGEIVRAKVQGDEFLLHEGGDAFIRLPAQPYTQEQISPTRDTRLRWMQSVIHCTHYIAGAGETQYLNRADAPEITYVPRDVIDRSDEAYTDHPA